MEQNSDIRADVEAFLAETNMSQTAFGKAALKDPRLVHGLRKGRRLWPETEARVREFMASRSRAETH
jgi:hypothetical protein